MAKKKASKKKASKKKATKASSGAGGLARGLALALAPAAAVVVTSQSFDDFIADADTPLGKRATTPSQRRQTRRYCEAEWDPQDICSMSRVEGAEFGWGMTRY